MNSTDVCVTHNGSQPDALSQTQFNSLWCSVMGLKVHVLIVTY